MSSAVSFLAHSRVVAMRPSLLGWGRWPLTKLKPSSWPCLSKVGDLVLDGLEPVVGLAGQFVGAEDALGVPALGVLEHGHPLVLVGQVAGQIDLVGGLDVEERLGLVLDRQLGDLERVDQLVARRTGSGWA